MKAQQAKGTMQRTSRKRFAAALCTAGVVAATLGGNLHAAAAEDAPVVTAPPTQTSSGASTAPTTTPTTPGEPAGTQTQAPQTHTADVPAADQPAGPAPVPAPAESPQAAAPVAPPTPTPTPAGANIKPLPLGGYAGPPELSGGVHCSGSAPTAKSRDAGADFSRGGASTSEQAAACGTASAESRRTISPERIEALKEDEAPGAVLRDDGGVPSVSNPTMSLALPGAVPLGVPNFFIDKFRIPPFLLGIYQAAGVEYGVRWEVLAAINEIETDYGRNLNVSSAGALGWMQFLPQTWRLYGTDANGDGRKDPFNPVDAIFSAARYLKAAGADQDLRRAIFAYNHADWYVESVLMRARLIGGMPADLVGSLSGLTQGLFPVVARARYADDIAERQTARRAAMRANAAVPVDADAARRGIDIFARAGSPVIAVQDATITAIGRSERLGRFVRVRDAYANTYTYAHLKKIATQVPVPKPAAQSKASIANELALPKRDPTPTQPASAGKQTTKRPVAPARQVTTNPAAAKERLFAHPGRSSALANGGRQQILELASTFPAGQTLKSYVTGAYGLDKHDVVLKRLAVGRRVIAGTILGRIGTTTQGVAPRLHFEIRPAGRGAPRIDPKPILDGWKLLESTAIYRAQGKNPLLGSASIGQIMLMSKKALTERVLANPRIEIYSCGRRDIQAGTVDRRVLATLEFLAASGLKPTITSLSCGHSFYTTAGNVSEHTSGNAVDIAKINGIPILGHQGQGSITDITIRRLLTLQGTTKPHQIISLMTYKDTDNTLALTDHADHIHIGYQPHYQPGTPHAHQLQAILKPTQWIKLIDRLAHINNPTVNPKPSKYAIPVPVRRASIQHKGE